jgi:pimeloyl-ACP methyl ester carboxylesterase
VLRLHAGCYTWYSISYTTLLRFCRARHIMLVGEEAREQMVTLTAVTAAGAKATTCAATAAAAKDGAASSTLAADSGGGRSGQQQPQQSCEVVLSDGASIYAVTSGPPDGPVVLLFNGAYCDSPRQHTFYNIYFIVQWSPAYGIDWDLWSASPLFLGHSTQHGAVLLRCREAGNLGMWAETMPLLARAGLRVVAHDCRAVGRSTAAPKAVAGSEQFTFEQYADDAVALLDELGSATAIVWGVAWGSRLATVFAIRHPSRCSGVVLSDMSVGVSTSKAWRVAQQVGGTLAADKMARLGIMEPKLAPYNEHSNKTLCGAQ